MKKLISIILFLTSLLAHGSSYICSITDQEAGPIEIKVKKGDTSVKLTDKNKTYKYKNCLATVDTLGTVLDCNGGNTDLMIYLNSKASPTKGTIMSATHNLYTDLKC